MKAFFNIKNKLSGSYAPRFLLTAILPASVVIALGVGLIDCSGKSSLFSSGSGARLQLIDVPMSLIFIPPKTSNLELAGPSDGSLQLVDTATALKVEVSGCATGYIFGGSTGGTITSVVNLYNGDRTCTIKLHGFTFQGNAYTDANDGAVAFSSWTAGQVATFSDVASGHTAANLITVFVNTQVSSPVTTSSTIVYNFTDISAGTTNTLSTGQVSTAVPLTVQGKTSPNYAGANSAATGGVVDAHYLSTNANGSGNMTFTIGCASNVTGSSPDFTCPNTDGSGDEQNGGSSATQEIRYSMVPDTYNACVSSSPTTLTVANANLIFSGTAQFTGQVVSLVAATLSATTTDCTGAAGQIATGGSDNCGTTGITHGGFDTVSMLTGATPIYSGASGTYTNGYQYLNDVLIIQRRDASSNTLSYLYWCINIAAITQS